jgi:hypothetical protein
LTDFRAGILTGFWTFLALFLKFSELGFRPGFFPGLLWPDFERFSGGTHESLEGTSGLCLGELSESLAIRGSSPPEQGFAIIARLSSGKDVQGSPRSRFFPQRPPQASSRPLSRCDRRCDPSCQPPPKKSRIRPFKIPINQPVL